MKSGYRVFMLVIVALLSLPVRADTQVAELFRVLNMRLGYMEDVAVYKQQHALPVEDLAREAVILEKARQVAAEHGLEPASVTRFFQAQMDVAKAIQYRRRADLLSLPSDRTPRDLKTQVRPELIRLGNRIVVILSRYLAEKGSLHHDSIVAFDRAITSRYVYPADKSMLFYALLEVKPVR